MNLVGDKLFWLVPDVSLSFGAGKLLWLALVIPLLAVAFAIDGQRRKRVLERIGHLPMIAQMIDSLSPGRRRLQIVCSVLGAGVLAIAISRPQVPGRARLSESRGLDLVVALDLSRSMLARDVYPSRLERAKAEISRLLDELKGDRVGMVAFAGETLSYPLSTDYEAAKLFWRDLQPSDMPVGGTDLGRAIAASTELLDRAAARVPEGRRKPGQVLILITDGEDTEARALDAARTAAAHGIHIYTIAIGSKDRPFVPIADEEGKPNGYLSGADGEPVRVGVDEEGLRKIAALSGGEYFTIEPRRFGVERVQQAIAGMERTEEEARLEREPEDIGRWFVLAAFLLIAGGAALGDRKRRIATAREDESLIDQPPSPSLAPRGRRAGLPASPVLVLVLFFPLLGGFDLFVRPDPEVEAGNRALAEGKAADALAAYDRAAAARPDDPTVRFDRGAALLKLNKLPEATREFQRAAESHEPGLKADAYYNLGVAQHKQEHFKEAVDAYKRALALRPEDRRTKWNLEVAQRRLKEQKEKPPQDQQNKDDQKQQDAKNQEQKQDQQKQDQQKQDQEKQASKQDQQKQDEKKADEKKADEKKADEKKADEKKAGEKKADEKKADEKKADEKKDEKREAAAAAERNLELEKQDAEAVLDALERVEPTVQKDLARRRAGNRKPKKDW